jgi:peptidoglycan/xylan/chitin deacetylase (PgdA/CDA1 family)
MTQAQLQDLSADGNEIGGHTVTHPDLTTLTLTQQQQQICGGRVALSNMGFPQYDFAYPFGATNAQVESVVQSCGYNAGRVVGGVVSPGTCNGCPYAETIPPGDPYATITPDSVTTTTTLDDLETYVTQAEQHGGGWVQIVMHHGCAGSGCPSESIDPAMFSSFLDWLQARGTSVKTVHQVIGGALQPLVQPPSSPATVSLSFDDDLADQYQVRSMLSSRGLHATFFVNSGSVGASTNMTWAQLHDLASDGNEIGGHTVGHANLLQVSTDEATRQVCNDRVNLAGQGFTVTDFAYPYGANNATIQNIVAGCGYNSARDVKGIVSQGGCYGCPFAETIPPLNAYDTRTPQNVLSTMSLADIEQEVTQAEQSGGGWVQIVFHHVCSSCDTYAVTAANLQSFLTWLQQRPTGTVVKTVNQVIGGPVQPVVPGPPPPNNQGIVNASLETDANGDLLPDCWMRGTSGTNSANFVYTNDAHSGAFAERIDMSSYTSGDAKLLVQQDLGQCSPSITAGHTYQISEWYKGSGQIAFTVYTRNSVGGWVFCKQSPFFYVSSPTWTQAVYTWSQPATSANCGINIGYTPTALSFGLALSSAGTLTTDDAAMADVPADTTPPTTTIACNGSPCTSTAYTKTVNVTLSAIDSGSAGVFQTRYTTDGTSPTLTTGSVYTGAVPISQTTTFKYRSWDTAGNVESTKTQTVTINLDATPPSVSLTAPADGATVSGSNVQLAATASDNVAVDHVDFYVGNTNVGTDSTFPYAVSWDSSTSADGSKQVTAVATDTAGNTTTSTARTIDVDNTAPSSSIACNGGDCGGGFTQQVSVTLDASDSGGSGVDQIRYTTDGSDPTLANGTTYSGAFVLGDTTTVKYRAWDKAGNAEDVNTQTITITIDTTPPQTTIACNGGPCVTGYYASGVVVSLTAVDSGSGVAAIRYTTDGSDPTASSTLYLGPFTLIATTTVKYRAWDNAGNVEPVRSQLVRVDGQAPQTTITCNNKSCSTGWYSAAVKVKLTATDTGGSGFAQIRYTTDGSDPTLSNGTVVTGVLTLTQTTTLKYRAWDNAGNAEAVKTQLIRIDTSGPAVTITAPASGAHVTGKVTIAANVTDPDSGVAKVKFLVDGKQIAVVTAGPYQTVWNTAKVAKGAHVITVTATDAVGNSTSVSISVTVT